MKPLDNQQIGLKHTVERLLTGVFKTVIFDLDGTLIDSAPSILNSIQAACFEVGIAALVPLHENLIGPPLPQLLQTVVGRQPEIVFEKITNAFKAYYDSTGLLQTQAFAGVDDLLADLADHGCALYIATNKRQIPTQRIIQLLRWDRFFAHVYSLDMLGSSNATKADLICHIVSTHQLQRDSTVYVGDRDEDATAAREAHVPFMLAAWGYEPAQSSSKSS